MDHIKRHQNAKAKRYEIEEKLTSNQGEVKIIWENHPLQEAISGIVRSDISPHDALQLKQPMTTIRVDGVHVPIGPTLMELGTPAAFGHGSETKTDLSIRNAHEVKAERLCEDDWKPLLERISLDLQPMMNRQPFLLVPYKLQMYTAGGHFKKHTDTVHHDNHIGTLLIRLPSNYTGGEFICSDQPWIIPEFLTETQYLNWVAFYTDEPHEVKPVKSGFRIMLQLEIYLDDPNDSTLPRERAWYSKAVTQESDYADYVHEYVSSMLLLDDDVTGDGYMATTCAFQKQAVFNALQDEIKDGHIPCFFLEHMYTTAGLLKGVFKDNDQALKMMFEDMGYSVIGVPALFSGSWEYDVQASPSDVSLYVSKVKLPAQAKTISDWRVFYANGQDAYMYTLQQTQAIAYTGNEAVSGNLQAVTGLMVVFPKYPTEGKNNYAKERSVAKRLRVKK